MTVAQPAISKFPDFVNQFNKYRDSCKWDYGYDATRIYGWRIPNSVKNNFVPHLENEWPDAPADLKNNFHIMFEPDHDMVGVNVIGSCSGDTLYLIKATERKIKTTIELGCFSNSSILKPSSSMDPVTRKELYWPMQIKIGSILVKDSQSGMEYSDIHETMPWGFVTWDANRYPPQIYDYEKVYISAKVNYKTGAFYLERYTKLNEENYDYLLEHQRDNSNSGDSESGGDIDAPGDSGAESGEDLEYKVKDVDTVSVEFTAYTGPFQIVWEYKLPTG